MARKVKLPRGVAAAAQRRSLRSEQGAPLPPDGSILSAYPTKSCVLIDAGDGEPAWHMIVMRIGGHGQPHVARLLSHPGASGWNTRMGDARQISEGIVVLASCWPYRASTQEAESVDPLALASVGGSLMLSHVRPARDPGTGPGQ
jgi:hypothetical protein